MRAPAVVLCGFCAQRSPGAPTVESIWLESGLPHGLDCGNLSRTPTSDYPLKVVWQGPRLAAGVLALLFGNRDALTLELCNRGEHGQHKLAGGRGRVDGLLAADEFHLLFGQAFYEIEQVARVSRKSADGLDNNRVAAAACAIQRCCRK